MVHWRNLGVPAHAILRTLLRRHRRAMRAQGASPVLVIVPGVASSNAQPRSAAPLRLHEQLLQLRKQRGLSRGALAPRVGMTTRELAQIEAGALRRLDLRTLERLAMALGARVRILLDSAPAKRGRLATRSGTRRERRCV